MVQIDVQFPDANEILVERFDSRVHALPVDLFQDDELLRIQRFLFVLTNRSEQAISAMTVLWSNTVASGRSGGGSTGADHFTEGIVRAYLHHGEQTFMGPGILHPMNRTGPLHGRLMLKHIENAESISISVDIVVFEDGQVIGPDSAGLIASAEIRKAAIRTVLDAVRSARASGHNLNSLLTQLSVPPARELPTMDPGFTGSGFRLGKQPDTLERQVSKIARVLQAALKSSALDATISRLETPIPAFYRK